MLVSLIAAMDRNRVIATEDGIPWELPRDREHFRCYTRGKAMLLGRVTYLEMRGWFTTQLPIVLSSQSALPARHTAASVPEAIALAGQLGAPELAVAGGAQVYRAAMPHVDTMVLTLIDARCGDGKSFPEWIAGEWVERSSRGYEADADNPFAFRIVTLERRRHHQIPNSSGR